MPRVKTNRTQPGAQFTLSDHLTGACLTRDEVSGYCLVGGGLQQFVNVVVDRARNVLARVLVGHDDSPRAARRGALALGVAVFTATGRVRTGARWANASRSCERPRWMRERTVPSLSPSVAAISS